MSLRVCLVGPVSPFRSGIARHTTALALEMVRRAALEVVVISFRRQFPRAFYPGASERDADARPPGELEVDFCLDSLSPASWRTAAKRALDVQPDLVVMPAWTFFTAPCLGFVARALRRRGVPVAMIVHNANDHEAAGWKTALLTLQLRQATRFIAPNAASATALARLVADVPCEVCPLPAFDIYPAPRHDKPRQAALELLCFGLVRPYKGIDVALRALAASGLGDVRLAIVGEFWDGRAATAALIGTLGLADRVEVVPHYVSDQEAAEYFDRCDALLAPYRSVTGSGVVALAQHYRRPVVASDLPGFAEAIAPGRTGWLFPPDDVGALAALLRTEVSRDAAAAMRPAIAAAAAGLSWARLADAALATARRDASHDSGAAIC